MISKAVYGTLQFIRFAFCIVFLWAIFHGVQGVVGADGKVNDAAAMGWALGSIFAGLLWMLLDRMLRALSAPFKPLVKMIQYSP